MKKFKNLKLSKSKKLRFIDNYFKKKLYIVFLHGFMSDIEGKKPQTLLHFAKKNKLGFLALEYSGHGKSSGNFTDGNISKWTNDAKTGIKKIVKENNFILVGSSMGSWISLNLFRYFKKEILGFIGIGSAPEFSTRLMWDKFNKKIKSELTTKGKTLIKSGKYEYPITYQLIKDGRKNKILNKKIKSKIGPRRPGDSKMVVANPSKFNKILNWKPKFNNLKYILKTAYEWEKKLNLINKNK